MQNILPFSKEQYICMNNVYVVREYTSTTYMNSYITILKEPLHFISNIFYSARLTKPESTNLAEIQR